MTTTNSLMPDGVAVVEFELAADQANAVVYALAVELTTAADELSRRRVTTTMGDLFAIGEASQRLARLSAIAEQLEWRAHWGPLGGEPPAVEAPQSVLLEMLAALQARHAEQERHGPDEVVGGLDFAGAARAVATAYAEAI